MARHPTFSRMGTSRSSALFLLAIAGLPLVLAISQYPFRTKWIARSSPSITLAFSYLPYRCPRGMVENLTGYQLEKRRGRGLKHLGAHTFRHPSELVGIEIKRPSSLVLASRRLVDFIKNCMKLYNHHF